MIIYYFKNFALGFAKIGITTNLPVRMRAFAELGHYDATCLLAQQQMDDNTAFCVESLVKLYLAEDAILELGHEYFRFSERLSAFDAALATRGLANMVGWLLEQIQSPPVSENPNGRQGFSFILLRSGSYFFREHSPTSNPNSKRQLDAVDARAIITTHLDLDGGLGNVHGGRMLVALCCLVGQLAWERLLPKSFVTQVKDVLSTSEHKPIKCFYNHKNRDKKWSYLTITETIPFEKWKPQDVDMSVCA